MRASGPSRRLLGPETRGFLCLAAGVIGVGGPLLVVLYVVVPWQSMPWYVAALCGLIPAAVGVSAGLGLSWWTGR